MQQQQALGTNSQCDFEEIGETGNGYKEYQLIDTKVAEVNQDCDKKSLRDLALSESDCIAFYKEPLFTCNFVAAKVPASLQSDVIKAETKYTFKVEDQAVIDIRALPSEVGPSATV